MSYPPQAPHDPHQFAGVPGSAPETPGPGAGPYPIQQPPARKRKKWPWVLGGIALVLILGCVGVFALIGFGAKTVSDGLQQADDNQKGRNAVDGKMNRPATDGKFQFTVTGMKCGATQVGSADFGQSAQGQYCMVDVTVKNVGKDAELFDAGSQKAYDASGTEYSTDSGAAVYVNDQNQTFLEDINPGNQVRGKLVYDVPKTTELAVVVLHESFYTAGVRVALS